MPVAVDQAVPGDGYIFGVFGVDRRPGPDVRDTFEIRDDQGIFFRILVEQDHRIVRKVQLHAGEKLDGARKPDPVRHDDPAAFPGSRFHRFPERGSIRCAPVSRAAVIPYVKFPRRKFRDCYIKCLKHGFSFLLVTMMQSCFYDTLLVMVLLRCFYYTLLMKSCHRNAIMIL